MKYQLLQKKLKELELPSFTPEIVSELLEVPKRTAQNLLYRYEKSGLVNSPKRGVYFLSDSYNDPYEMSYWLYQPSYISFETALAKYSIIPEVVYAIVCATTRKTREFEFGGTEYLYRKIKTKAFTGYIREGNYFIAEPEKALADYLYFVATKGYSLNGRLDLKNVDKKKASSYCKMFDSEPLLKLTERVLC